MSLCIKRTFFEKMLILFVKTINARKQKRIVLVIHVTWIVHLTADRNIETIPQINAQMPTKKRGHRGKSANKSENASNLPELSFWWVNTLTWSTGIAGGWDKRCGRRMLIRQALCCYFTGVRRTQHRQADNRSHRTKTHSRQVSAGLHTITRAFSLRSCA